MSKKYKILYLPIARKDLIEIIEYIQQDNPSAALELLNKIEETISKLENFPYMGTQPKDSLLQYKGYRVLIIESFLVFYVVKGNKSEVEIRRIIHGKRKYDFLL
ncbi:type II toxin-antitoxin system mRNA interferase toxin, RelE/StbE family [Halothermothrix orenii]|uniref:Addiction module toxin, RelE/StbE family n=1 Tax=Halothermothrix orenii (strain H 168 / OCM 544 / DSM 9562) TaxID=373903 RepID=B8CXV5_HALOH|nr:type II toxin-antitoxin system mRNA interferase toxin, RelE/StbE family [Halothermothrix orenii]ACL70124.1 addiction module toxin, RelE/StbE family [Halothermothrix orenii H 168]